MARKTMRVVMEIEVEDLSPKEYFASDLDLDPIFDAEKYYAEEVKSGVYMGMVGDSTAMELAEPLNEVCDYEELMREIFAGSNLFVNYTKGTVVSAEYVETKGE